MPSYRVIKSGHIIEIYKYQKSVAYGYEDDFKSREGGRHNEGIESRKKEYRGQVNVKAFNTLRRLINANFNENSLFITLTYKKNMQDIEASNENLKKFLQKMKRRQKDFKYVWVMEFQKRGAIHYHMLCNYDISWNSLEELQNHERILGSIWTHGFVDIGYKRNDNAGAYLLKYMTKEHDDERLNGQKRYSFSRNLDQPKELVGGEAVDIIRELEGLPPVFTSEYFSDFHGKVEYMEFNPLRYDYNEFLIRREETLIRDLENMVEIASMFTENLEVIE
jgi:hypothetical protein